MSDSLEVKTDRVYSKEHEWALVKGDEIEIGITAYAVDQLGDVTLVSFDVKEGDEIEAGKIFGTIESVKTLSDLYAPLSGKITRINNDLDASPETINEDCWEKGWMLAITPSDPSEKDKLLSADDYKKFIATA